MFRFACRLLPPVLFVAILMLPAAQQVLVFAPERPLGGAVAEDAEPAPRTLAAWHEGKLQREVEAAVTKHLGLRDWMVRLDNQLKWSIFGVAKRPVYRGPGDWLVDEGYLPARTHTEPVHADGVLARAVALLCSQMVLAEHGVTQILLVTPSKAELEPENLPFPIRQAAAAQHTRDIDVLRAILDLGFFNYVDSQALFERWAGAEPSVALFPRCGTHWSSLGAAKVTCHLLDRLEEISGVDGVNLRITSAELGAGTSPGEDDMVVLANLLFEDGLRPRMPVPVLDRVPGDAGTPQGLLMVTSSFGWLPMEHISRARACHPQTTWYYFRGGFEWKDDGTHGDRFEVDRAAEAFRREVLRHKFVVVECNVSMIRNLGFGFPERVCEVFGLPKPTGKELTIEKITAIRELAARPYRTTK